MQQEEQLLLEWTLFPKEIEFVKKQARGPINLLRYSIQLCHLKDKGHFVSHYNKISITVLNFIAKQVNVDLVHELLTEPHSNTEGRIRSQVSRFLGFRDFGAEALIAISSWLDYNVLLLSDKNELLNQVKQFLIKEKFILPGNNKLTRTVFNIYAQSQKELFNKIFLSLDSKQKSFIADICDSFDLADKGAQKFFAELRKPIGDPNVKNITEKICFLKKLQGLKLFELPWSNINVHYIQRLAKLVDRYSITALKRINPKEKRYTMVVCYLYESTKSLLDEVIQAVDKLLMEVERRIDRDFEIDFKMLRSEANKSARLALSTLKQLRAHDNPASTTITEFCEEVGNENLDKIIKDCETVEQFEKCGKLEIALRRYSYLINCMKEFLNLDFKATKGSEDILKAIEIFNNYHNNDEKFPQRVPYEFIDTPWKEGIFKGISKIDRRSWEVGLFFAVKKSLRAANLYVPDSRQYRDFWAPLYKKKAWDESKPAYYSELGLPENPKVASDKLRFEFDEHLNKAWKFFGPNQFAEVKNGRLIIHSDDALIIPSSTKELQSLVDSYSEPIRIEQLLHYIQRKTNYIKAFKPIEGFDPRAQLDSYVLDAAITAHATNLGIYGMSKSTNGISADKLRHISNWFVTSDNLKRASDVLIDYHQKYWLTNILGDGKRSSSDGQRFVINQKGLVTSMHPRYFGVMNKGGSVYTHVSNQCSVFTDVLSCGDREALYVLEGFTNNQSVIKPSEHSTDTHGFTEILFALCYLFGISFQPRFKDLKDQQLYCFNRKCYDKEKRILFSQERINEELISEQWDDIIRLIFSLKQNLIQPHVIIYKLQQQNASTKLAKALLHLGRLVKTIYILRYFHDAELRYAVRKQLNRGECRHFLARHIFFAEQGAFKTSDYQEIMNKASCLSFVSNAVVLWNTEQLQNIYELLKHKGYKVQEEDMARILPLSFKKLIVNGVYDFYIKDDNQLQAKLVI